MKTENFCKIFILSLISFISFFISTIFLTSINNVKSQSDFFFLYRIYEFREEDNDTYSSYYSGIAALYSFILISLVIFSLDLILLIKRDKIDQENNDINQNENNDENIRDVRIELNNNIINNHTQNSERDNYRGNDDNNNSNEQDSFDEFKIARNILIYSFIAIQIFYFIELIVISAFHTKSKNIVDNYKNKLDKDSFDYLDYLTTIITILIIVGYSFFFIFIIFYLYLLILFNILPGTSKKKLEKCTNSSYCKCLNDCIERGCEKFANCLKPSEMQIEEDELIDNERRNEIINKLTRYKDELRNFNNNIRNENERQNELIRLNLYDLKINV